MFRQPELCPNKACQNHHNPAAGFYRKRGKYKTLDGHTVQRYQCRDCLATFSNRTLSDDRLQRLDINKELFGLVCSGCTIRRSAVLLGVSANTVMDRMAWLAGQARKAHAAAHADGSLLTGWATFDEMVTRLRSKDKKINIALVVRAKTGQILSAKVIHPTRKTLFSLKQQPAQARAAALTEAAKSIRPYATITCDGWPTYPGDIAKYVGKNAWADVQLSRAGTGGFDPMFRLNHVCAKLRADIACLARRTWTTAQTLHDLQEKLDLYVAWNNGYLLGL